MPVIQFTPARRSVTDGRNKDHDGVQGVVGDHHSVMIESSSDEGDGDDNDIINEHFVREQSISSRSSSSSSSLFGRLFPFHRAMEEARRIVFHPAREPPQVDEFDWKVEFRPATSAGCKRSSYEASAPSEPMVTTPYRRKQAASPSGRSGDGPCCSSFSATAARLFASEKAPVVCNNMANQHLEYTRPAKRTKIEGGGSSHGLFGTAGILRTNQTTEYDDGSIPTTASYNGSPDRTSASALQHESAKTKDKRLRFVESRMRVVKRLKVGNLINFGGGGSGQRKRHGYVAFAEETSNPDEEGEYDIAGVRQAHQEEDSEFSRSSRSSGVRFVKRFGSGTLAEF